MKGTFWWHGARQKGMAPKKKGMAPKKKGMVPRHAILL